MKQKSFYRAPLLTASTVTLLTALLFIFQNFDLPTYAVPPVTWVSGSEYNGQPSTGASRPYSNQPVTVYEASRDKFPGWVADSGASLQLITDSSLADMCSQVDDFPLPPYNDYFCADYQFHLYQRNSANAGESSLRLNSQNYLSNQLYQVVLEVKPNRHDMRLDLHVNRIRQDSAVLTLAEGGPFQTIYFHFYANHFANELALVTDQAGDALKIRSLKVTRLAIEDQLLVNGNFDRGFGNWKVDSGPQVSVTDGVLKYKRQNAAYYTAFMRTQLSTIPGRFYKVETKVLSNSKMLRYTINGKATHDFTSASGTDSFVFQATQERTELGICGAGMWLAEFSLDSIQVVESTNADFELGLLGWTADPGLIVSASKDNLSYQRNNTPWPDFFIDKKVNTTPGTQYQVSVNVASNNKTLRFMVDGRLVKESNLKNGLVKFLFKATNAETVVSIGGANSLSAAFQLTSADISPFWSPGGQYLFQTSTKYSGYLGGYRAADQYCADHATKAGLPGSFKAVIDTRHSSYAQEDEVPQNRLSIVYPLMNSSGYYEGLCDEKGNCENLGDSWVGFRGNILAGAYARTCNNWIQHDLQPTITYDSRGNPISTPPTIPDWVGFGAIWPASLSVPDFEHTYANNRTGANCATDKRSLMCLQDAATASYTKRKYYGVSFNDFLGPVDYRTGPRYVEGNQYIFRSADLGGAPGKDVKVLSPLLRNNNYYEGNPHNNYNYDRPLGNYYVDNLEVLASGQGVTIEFPEPVSSASFDIASLSRLSPLPYEDSHKPLNFGGEESSYEALINGRVVLRFTVPKFNPEEPSQYQYFGVIQVTTADHSPFRKVQIRVIEGPTDLLRLYRIGYVTNN